MSLVLGGGEHMKHQTIRAWHIGNGEIEAASIHQRRNKCDAGEPIELRNQQCGLAPLRLSIS
jgi:hypothetical protein